MEAQMTYEKTDEELLDEVFAVPETEDSPPPQTPVQAEVLDLIGCGCLPRH
jgi:hypothetical protein